MARTANRRHISGHLVLYLHRSIPSVRFHFPITRDPTVYERILRRRGRFQRPVRFKIQIEPLFASVRILVRVRWRRRRRRRRWRSRRKLPRRSTLTRSISSLLLLSSDFHRGEQSREEKKKMKNNKEEERATHHRISLSLTFLRDVYIIHKFTRRCASFYFECLFKTLCFTLLFAIVALSLSLCASLSLSRSQSLFPCARARVRAFTYVCGFLQMKNVKKRARRHKKKLVKSNKSQIRRRNAHGINRHARRRFRETKTKKKWATTAANHRPFPFRRRRKNETSKSSERFALWRE